MVRPKDSKSQPMATPVFGHVISSNVPHLASIRLSFLDGLWLLFLPVNFGAKSDNVLHVACRIVTAEPVTRATSHSNNNGTYCGTRGRSVGKDGSACV